MGWATVRRAVTAGVAVWLALAGAGCAAAAQAPAPPVQAVQPSPAPRTVTASGALSGVTEQGPGGVAVLPFAEADAAAVRPDQTVRLTFPAVPGLTLPGRVHAIAPTAVSISGVTNYWVTIALLAGDPRLRAGMSVTAEVTVG